MHKLLPLFVLLLLVLLAPLARAGVRIETVTTKDGKSMQTVLSLEGKKLRMEHSDPANPGASPGTSPNPSGTAIFDGERLLVLSPASKSYSELTLADLKAQLAKIEAMRSQLPPAAQAELDKRSTPPRFTFERTAGGDTLAGFKCQNYLLQRDGHPHGTACLAAWASGAVRKEDLGPIQTLMQSMSALTRLAAPGELPMTDIDQWPGWALSLKDESGQETLRTTAVRRGALPASLFSPPADYVKSAGGLGGLGMSAAPPQHHPAPASAPQ